MVRTLLAGLGDRVASRGLCCGFVLLVAQAGAPPLPDLAIENFPVASRAAIQPALDEARRAMDDEAIVGRLGMTLQAWDQWEAAHATYLRARALAGDRSLDVGQAPGASARPPRGGDAIRPPARPPREGATEGGAFRWAYLDAVVLQRSGRADEAVAALNGALAARADYLPARVTLAEALFDAGRVDESARAYAALVKEPAAAPVAEFGLGRIAAAAGRHEEAIAHLQRSIASFPEYGAAHYALARSARALGRTDEARRALERHQAFGARWPAIADPVLLEVAGLRSDARAALLRGQKLAGAGDLAGAIAAHEEALALVRPSAEAQVAAEAHVAVEAHRALIVLYGRAEDWAKADAHYRAALAIGQELEDAHYNYGVLLGRQGRWDDAAAAYRQALAINPLHPQARNNLGQILERSRAFEEAAGEYRRAVDAAPAFRLARFNLGRMLIALRRPQEALVQLERLTEPRDAEASRYLFALATAYIHLGQKDHGVKWATEARRLALEHGQQDLAAAIDRELSGLR